MVQKGRAFLNLSLHLPLSSIAPSRYQKLHPVSAQSRRK